VGYVWALEGIGQQAAAADTTPRPEGEANTMEYNGICHVEWESTDLDRSRGFYGGLFGWTFETWGDATEYMLFSAPGGIGGGFMKKDAVSPSVTPTVYVLVESIEAYLPRAASLGGRTSVPKTEIPGMGWFALVNDPDGNTVGLFEARPEQAGS
jgi:uncharacterized protein